MSALNELVRHQNERNLVSIRRDRIDRNSIQGFVLAAAEELLVLQYVYDFNLDGLMVVRLADLTDVKCSATDRFQKGLLEREGAMERVSFGAAFDLRNWRTVIDQLSSQHKLMILECEEEEEKVFLIGRVLKTTPSRVHILNFSGVANWDDDPAKPGFKSITCCQVGNSYLNHYQRFFDAEQP